MRAIFVFALALASCTGPVARTRQRPAAIFLKMDGLAFQSPWDHSTFELILGSYRDSENSDFSDLPEGLNLMRNQTSSRYRIKDRSGTTIAEAESSLRKDLTFMMEDIKVQYEPTRGKILITEDSSDGLPAKRYLLFTPTPTGYLVQYLAPRYESGIQEVGFPASPPELILLSNDSVWVDNFEISLLEISKSETPFTVGG